MFESKRYTNPPNPIQPNKKKQKKKVRDRRKNAFGQL